MAEPAEDPNKILKETNDKEFAGTLELGALTSNKLIKQHQAPPPPPSDSPDTLIHSVLILSVNPEVYPAIIIKLSVEIQSIDPAGELDMRPVASFHVPLSPILL